VHEPFSILIVEDDHDARSNMEDILSLDSYAIESVSHCLPAIQAIERRHFDTVIVDWKLPDGDGSQLIPIIKQELPDAPVVVVTGMREFDTAVTALRNGAYDFLSKPINPDALRGLLRRIVERKYHLAEIESAQARLVANERLAAIGEMVTGLAHESRNAFQRSHACLAELSLDVAEMPDSLQLVRKVQRALDDLNMLLEEVRNYAAPINLERRECQIVALVEETWQQIMEAKRLETPPELLLVSDPVAPKVWFIDADRIRQIVRNLLENAIFASSRSGHVLLEIGYDDSTSSPELILSVSDDGDGVPEEHRAEIFSPFFTTKTKGTGLGLAISRRVAQAHQGNLSVSDADLGGAKFTLRMPRQKRSILKERASSETPES
jgi:signal transduction histidine kinase